MRGFRIGEGPDAARPGLAVSFVTVRLFWIFSAPQSALAGRLEQFTKIIRKKEARAENAGQGGGRRRADARQGQQRSHAFSEPLNFSQYFWVLL